MRRADNRYAQLTGSIDELRKFDDEIFDMIICHNVLEHANILLDGKAGMASKYGAIHYYEDEDIEKWCPELAITKIFGMRTFWDMQQNQEIHKDTDWQDYFRYAISGQLI